MALREGSAVRLLDAQPDLGQGLDALQVADARRYVVARAVDLRPGTWTPPTVTSDHDGQCSLLVIEGVVSRTVTLAGRTVIELLGPEDLLRPWDDQADATSVDAEIAWTVLRPTRLALLDESFAARVAPWPPVSAALLARAVARSRWLVRHLAILDQPRLDVRLVLLFWELADRWGTVSPDGVSVPLPLTHQTLGRIIRAQRPSVTAALKELRELGFLRREPDGTWVIRGDPSEQLGQLAGE
jgi:CRP/FNR family transcriptional regulator, cyclic AMP receptor protein